MIVITGATGQLGSRIVEHLLTLVPADQVGVSVRDVDKARGLAERGVRVRHGDYRDAASLSTAFEGASQLLLVSSVDLGDEGEAQHRTAIDAARVAGAGRVLYTSHQAVGADSEFAPGTDHARSERLLAEAHERHGIAVTSLRNGFHANTLDWLTADAIRTGTLAAPADGPVSWTTRDDLGAAAAVVLADDGRLDGLAAPLTAPQALDLADVAGLLSEISGRTIARVVVADEDYQAQLVEHGLPAERADLMLGLFRAARRGEFDVTDPTLEKLLGRRATSVRSVLEDLVARS